MATNTIDADSIGAKIDLEAIDLPAEVGKRMQTLYGTERVPQTAADWTEMTEAAIQESLDRKPSVEDLCTTEDGAHAFEPANDTTHERQEYVCVLDPIGYPYLTDTPGTITSTTPIREATVTVEVDRDGIESSHSNAVISLGLSNNVDYVEKLTPEVIYRQVCGYIQTFEDDAEYKEWAGTVDAATKSVPLETGVGLAGTLAKRLFQ